MHVRRAAPSLDEKVAAVHGRIEALLARIAMEADGGDGALGAYVSEGKRLRARLVVMSACVGERWDDEVVAACGAFVELVHAGGLCHDDVVDRSPQRRSRTSLAFSHGARSASFAGLYLMIRAYSLVADAPPVVRRAIAGAAERVAIGQADEMLDLYRWDVDPATYVERCRAKTGALFELAAELGARAANVDPVVRDRLARFGADMGVAFQLVDDVRDLQGEAVLGRASGTDLREGVYTLPVLRTAQGCHDGDAELRALLRRLRRTSEPDSVIADVRRLLCRNGSIAATLDEALDAVRRAVESIDVLAPAARSALKGFVDAAVRAGVPPPGRATAA